MKNVYVNVHGRLSLTDEKIAVRLSQLLCFIAYTTGEFQWYLSLNKSQILI